LSINIIATVTAGRELILLVASCQHVALDKTQIEKSVPFSVEEAELQLNCYDSTGMKIITPEQ
jgi:hypothetical protein